MGTELTERRRPVGQESLFRASGELERVLESAAPTEAWFAAAHAAVRAGVVAVEARLHAVMGANGLGGEIATREPRLLPALGKLEADLARLLIDFWEASAMPAERRPALAPHLVTLAAEMRAVAGEEFDLVVETANPPGGQD